MASLMMEEMGIKAVTGLTDMYVNAQSRKIAEIQRKFQNTMAALSAAQSRNQVTRNEASVHDQVAFAQMSNQVEGAQEIENMRLAAATVGASGNSVRSTLGAGARVLAQKQLGLELDQKAQYTQMQDQRREIGVSEAYGKSINIIPNQIGMQLMGVASSLLDTYKDYQPPGI